MPWLKRITNAVLKLHVASLGSKGILHQPRCGRLINWSCRNYATLPPAPYITEISKPTNLELLDETDELVYEMMRPEADSEELTVYHDGKHKLYPAEYFDSSEKILQVLGEGPSKEMINVECARRVVEYLHGTKANGMEIVKMLKRQPYLMQESEEKWREHVHFFLEHGFRPTDVVRMFSVCPSLLTVAKLNNVQETFGVFRKLAMGEKSMLEVMRYRPVILAMSAHDLQKQLEKLSDIFPRKDIIKLLPVCPNIMFERFEDLNNKVQYVLFKMNLEQNDIVHSRLLSYTFDYIRLRCEFVKRCGKFTPPNPKKRKLYKNPSLRDIVDSPDTVFATKICGVSTREYAVFPHLFQLEEQDKLEDEEEEKYFEAMAANYHNFPSKPEPSFYPL